MTGAVDLVVAGSQFVNPSLAKVAKDWKVTVVPTDGLNQNQDPQAFAQKIVEQAEHAFEMRQNITRDIPMVKASAVMGYSAVDVDIKKIVDAHHGKIWVESPYAAGKSGTKFTVVIPRDLATPEMKQEEWRARRAAK